MGATEGARQRYAEDGDSPLFLAAAPMPENHCQRSSPDKGKELDDYIIPSDVLFSPSSQLIRGVFPRKVPRICCRENSDGLGLQRPINAFRQSKRQHTPVSLDSTEYHGHSQLMPYGGNCITWPTP